MATKGKTRGPKESKHVKKNDKQDANYATRRKRQQKQIGSYKK
jgi:hypothetical protein